MLHSAGHIYPSRIGIINTIITTEHGRLSGVIKMKYQHNIPQSLFKQLIISGVCLLFIACAGHQGIEQNSTIKNQNPYSGHLKSSNRISGHIVAEDGYSPLVGATVYIPSRRAAPGKKIIKDLSLGSISLAGNANTCDKPKEPYVIYTCTNRAGAFYLNLTQVQEFPIHLAIINRENTRELALSLDDLGTYLGAIDLSIDQEVEKQKIAIVTDLFNPYEQIQKTLNDQHIDSTDIQIDFIQDFYEVFDIDSSQSCIEFTTLKILLEDNDGDAKADINNYQVVYLNSHNESDITELSRDARKKLIQFIADGGELYITSWKFELVEPTIDNYI